MTTLQWFAALIGGGLAVLAIGGLLWILGALDSQILARRDDDVPPFV